MTITTYTLWWGHCPLIRLDSESRDDRLRYRIDYTTVTQGAVPAHIESLEHAQGLARLHAVDGQPLDIQTNWIEA